MSTLDLHVVAERAASIERHLARVQAKLPASPDGWQASTDASDAVILHLWQAVQIVIDLGVSLCVRLNLGAPTSYAERSKGSPSRGTSSVRSPGGSRGPRAFENAVAHAYEAIDVKVVHDAAKTGPTDLRAFLARVRDLARPVPPTQL